MSLTIVIFISVISILIEGFFSGSEIALVSSDKLALERKAKDGHHGAQLAINLLDNSGLMLSITLIGTNLAVITNTIVVTLYCLDKFGAEGELYSLAIMSPAILLFGEIIPKTLFQQYSDVLSPKISYVLYYAKYLFFPLVLLLRFFSGKATNFLGIHKTKAQALSREDLKLLIEENISDENELTAISSYSFIREGEREIISNILNLRDTIVEEIMLPMSEVISVSQEATLEELLKIVEEHGFTRIPVYKHRVDRIVGIVHSFDILSAKNLNQKVYTIMKPPIFVPETEAAFRLLVDLQKARKGMSIIVNEYGGAEGIVTIEDVVEEIVGEIEDEFDKPEETITQLDEKTYILSGRVSITQLNENLGFDFDEDADYETIAGLMLFEFKKMPTTGDFIYLKDKNIKLTVTDMSDRAILTVKLEILNSNKVKS